MLGMVIGLVGEIRVNRNYSFTRKEICNRTSDVLGQISWIMGNGQLINLLQDNWLADVPLSGWPTFISIDINDQVQVSDLFHQQGKGWNTQMVV